MPAIMFRSPINTPSSDMIKVNRRALRGSLLAPYPLAKSLGTMWSLAMACNMRGPPSMPPSAEESVAPHIPAITKAGIQASCNKKL